MSLAIYEEFGSREGESQKSTELKWIVIGSDDDIAIEDLLNVTAPASYRGMSMQGKVHKTQKGYQLWEGVAQYAAKENDKGDGGEGDNQRLADQFQFDTTGGTIKITNVDYATKTRAYPRATPTDGAPRQRFFAGQINVKGRDVEGCEIIAPKLRFSTKRNFSPSRLNWTWLKSLARNTGKTNATPFQTFAVGELLFMGASGECDTQNPSLPVTFNFEASENITGLAIGGIQGIRKDGWDFLWIDYGPEEEVEAKSIVPKPWCVYVHKVYNEFNLAELGL